MSKDFGLVPPRKTERYTRGQGEGTNRDWSRNEDHILRAVLLSCQTEHDYFRACYFLCQLLERRPAKWSGKHVGQPYLYDVRNCEKLLANRIWDMVTGYRNFVPDLVYNEYTREGRGLCYGEVEIYLPKWLRTKSNKRPPLSHVALILGRSSTDILQEAIDNLHYKRGFMLPEDGAAKVAFDEQRAVELKQELLALCFDKAEDQDRIRQIWRELDQLYRQ